MNQVVHVGISRADLRPIARPRSTLSNSLRNIVDLVSPRYNWAGSRRQHAVDTVTGQALGNRWSV